MGQCMPKLPNVNLSSNIKSECCKPNSKKRKHEDCAHCNYRAKRFKSCENQTFYSNST